MHLLVILIALAVIWRLRQTRVVSSGTWSDRWYRSLFLLLFPPLLLLTTAISIICMGGSGMMLGVEASWLGYAVAVGYLIFAGCWLIIQTSQGSICLNQLRSYEQRAIAGTTARILDTDFPYSAQVGFWNSQLVISRGLLDTLDEEHLQAVLAHEQAHFDYRDTFWFFWLGWMRQIAAWLPNTELLWQELLLLRELRADRRAAEQVDFLLLAESLLTVAQTPVQSPMMLTANFSSPLFGDRLKERIDFLLAETDSIPQANWRSWTWIIWLFFPLFIIPLHY
ncbi:MAG: M56 family metallopeptidase [Pleurocapsa sp.]